MVARRRLAVYSVALNQPFELLTSKGFIIVMILRCPKKGEIPMAFLTPAQVEQFHEQGYLIVDNLFDPVQDLDPVM